MHAKDDVTALLQVLDDLSVELTSQREEINKLCVMADRVGGIEPLPVQDLSHQLETETVITKASLDTLKVAEHKLTELMGLLRDFRRVKTVRSLSLHAEWAAEVEQLKQTSFVLFNEQMALQAEALKIDSKIAKLASLFI